MREVLIGQTDYTVFVKIVSTSGAPVTGLAHTDIDIAYARVETDNDVTTADVTPADLANLTAAHSDWGWEEVSSTDHPGLYRLDIADAVFASGAWEAVVTITDASGTDFYAVDIGFRLVNIDPQASVVPANVTQFGGSNGTFSGGRPEVNTTHAAGTAWNSGAIGASTVADGTIDRATFAADTGLQSVRSNTAQAGGATSITLDASASATTDFYKHCLIYLTGGTGAGQFRLCTAYNGTTKVATVTPAWATNPDATSTFAVIPQGIVNVEAYGGAAGTFSSGIPAVNATQISGDATAADNLEAILDGTGGVTLVASAFTLTTPIQANAVQISGDTTAADNCELFFDGTGYNAANSTVGTVTLVTTTTTLTNLPAITANWLTASGLAADAANEIADALLDRADAIETSITLRQAVRYVAAATAGLLSGSQTSTEVFKGIGQASGGTTRITATVDSSGNRSAITLG